jgi:hypothetical protein
LVSSDAQRKERSQRLILCSGKLERCDLELIAVGIDEVERPADLVVPAFEGDAPLVEQLAGPLEVGAVNPEGDVLIAVMRWYVACTRGKKERELDGSGRLHLHNCYESATTRAAHALTAAQSKGRWYA